MSIIGKLGVAAAGEAIGQTAKPIEAIGGLLDRLFTSKEEKLAAEELLERLRQQPHLAQVELTKVEAQHSHVFVAGWRPFIGWVCGSALAYSFIVRDLLGYALKLVDPAFPDLPAVQFEHLEVILLGMLGLGGMRTFEKVKGAEDSAKTMPKERRR